MNPLRRLFLKLLGRLAPFAGPDEFGNKCSCPGRCDMPFHPRDPAKAISRRKKWDRECSA